MQSAAATELEQENPLTAGLERVPVRDTALVIFGATGDLAHRKLLPALYNLAHEGALPERFEMIGVARREQEDVDFQEMARQSIERFSRRRPDASVLDGLIEDMRYVPGRSTTTRSTPSWLRSSVGSTSAPASRSTGFSTCRPRLSSSR